MRNYNIYVPTRVGKKVINCSEIIYMESVLGITKTHLVNDQVEEILLSISELEYLLRKRGFFRFNNKNLVNLRYVQVVFPLDASKVILENGKEIFVCQNKKEDLFESLKQVFELQEMI